MEVLRYTNPLFRRFYSELYIEFVNKRPELLGWVYDALDKLWGVQKRRRALDRLNTGSLMRLLIREKPLVAVCTHFLPADILLHVRQRKNLNIPVGIAITDFDAHAMWLFQDVDWYFVACEKTRVYLSAVSVPSEKVFVTGIPIHPDFGQVRSRRAARKTLGPDTKRTLILISAGGLGVGPVQSFVQSVQGVQTDIQAIVVCGRNRVLQRNLQKLSKTRHTMKIVAYTHEIHTWMAASDFMVGKAGELISSEALASGLVLVIVNPVPGQEERNSDHFLEQGVAIRCNNLPALAFKIEGLMRNRRRFTQMQRAVKKLDRPHAASNIVSIVMI